MTLSHAPIWKSWFLEIVEHMADLDLNNVMVWRQFEAPRAALQQTPEEGR